MGDHAITIVELDAREDVAERRAREVTEWLLAEGIARPNGRPDLFHPSVLVPGPNARDVAPDAWQFLDLANNGIDVIATREVHHPVENYEPPRCPVCQSRIDPDIHHSLMEEWLVGAEPTITCANCGDARRIGDWIDEFTFYVANLAVRFNNWSPLTDEFTERLGSRLGPRWRVVRTHM